MFVRIVLSSTVFSVVLGFGMVFYENGMVVLGIMDVFKWIALTIYVIIRDVLRESVREW